MSDASSTPPPQPTVQTAFAAYSGPPLDTVRSIVASQFQVRDAFLDPNGIQTILVASELPKEKFKIVLDQLATHGVLAALRASEDAMVLKVFQSRRPENLAGDLTSDSSLRPSPLCLSLATSCGPAGSLATLACKHSLTTYWHRAPIHLSRQQPLQLDYWR